MYKIFFIKTLLAIILVVLQSYEVNSFGKRRSRCNNKYAKQPTDANDRNKFYNLNSQEDCIDPHCDCESIGFGIVEKIPYPRMTALSSSNYNTLPTINIQFSSACIRCGLCLAVAEQINQTLLDTHDRIQTDHWLNDTEATYLFKEICETHFRHYSLREIQGKRYICDRIPGAKLVTSTGDGLWEKNLRDKCKTYVKAAGAVELYKYWQRWSGLDRRLPDLITILCRGDEGIFRDCKSIPNLSKPELKRDNSIFSKLRVIVEIKCK